MNRDLLDNILVIGLGQACVDYLGRINAYPAENGKEEIVDLYMCCGGPASTALVTLSRLGISTSFLGSVSNDLFGQEIVKNLEKENVDMSCLKITPGYSSQFAFIAITTSGKRTVFWHRGSVPALRSEDIDLRLFPNARLLHLDGLMIDASIEAARQARAMGMTVVMDGGTLRKGTRDLAPLVDILIVSETFASALVGSETAIEDALYAIQNLGPEQVVVTLGEKGSIGLNKKGIFRQEAFAVRAVDTTGAGDVYHGAYIYGILQIWEMRECMRFASAAAALKCKGVGAQYKIQNLNYIRGVMKKEILI
jgi:sulfofructose kinase